MRVMLYDETDGLLTASWALGAWWYRKRQYLDAYKGITKLEEGVEWLEELALRGPLDKIELWCHGSPGKFYVGEKAWSENLFKTHLGHRLRQVALNGLEEGSLFWLRTCASFAGRSGLDFARCLSEELGCRVAGHTHAIGLLQSGLHSVAYGDSPQWSDEEGLDRAGKAKGSRLWAPNTIPCTQSQIPRGW